MNKYATTLGILALLLAAPASAEPSSEVAFDAPTRALLANASVEKGKELASKCERCHGDLGITDDEETPNIAGQMATYTFKQMMDYKHDFRENSDMNKRAAKLSEEEIADLAVYYASLEPAPAEGKADATTLDLVFRGDPERMLKPCGTCHGRSGQGGKYDSATLTGQNPDYFVITMAEFQEGDRTNDIYSRMRLVAEALTPEEIDALAEYYAAPIPEQ